MIDCILSEAMLGKRMLPRDIDDMPTKKVCGLDASQAQTCKKIRKPDDAQTDATQVGLLLQNHPTKNKTSIFFVTVLDK